MPTNRSLLSPWFFLILAGLVALVGSGDLSARDIGTRIFVWLIAAAIVAAIQSVRIPARDQTETEREAKT